MIRILLLHVLLVTLAYGTQQNFAPQLIRLAVTGQPSSFSISWSTIDMPKNPIVRFGRSPDALTGTAPAVTTSYLPRGKYKDPTLVYYHHHALLQGLQPNTVYYYSVGSDNSPFSRVKSFKTQPSVDSTHSANITFVVYGDMGVMNSANTLLRMMELIEDKKIDLIFHVGDISYADDYDGDKYETVWNTFMGIVSPVSSSVPYMVTPGNHEYSCEHRGCDYSKDFAAYRARYNMPGFLSGSNTSMWYSFDYGGVHFVGVSTESDFPGAPEAPTLFGNQLAWLKADLEKANANRKNVPWIIVGGHRPMYASSEGYSKNGIPIKEPLALQKAMEELFKTYKVDMFVVGHVHSYERTWPMYNNQITARDYRNPTAPVYVIVGCAGNEEGLNGDDEWLPQPEWSAFRYNDDWGYILVQTIRTPSSDILTYKFITSSDNVVRDMITIEKSRSY